uniref:Uncharacterized protein n=1 Tax=Anguilla anguilla TaxID=7936 RepID=A0A0E9QWU7_ANGAN
MMLYFCAIFLTNAYEYMYDVYIHYLALHVQNIAMWIMHSLH